jgi:hypothetical protein
MMRSVFSVASKRAAHICSCRSLAEPASAKSVDFLTNLQFFCKPLAPIYSNKVSDIPTHTLTRAADEYGVTYGHSPIISRLESGAVSVVRAV